MWVLLLNDMRSSNIENLRPVGRAVTKEALLRLLESETVAPYKDGQWGKSYRAGGPLEWFNPPWEGDEHRHFQNAGTEDDWAESARRSYRDRVESLPVIAT